MPTYLVRTSKDFRLVGVFKARDASRLCGIVDEMMGPSGLEFMALENDEGIFVDGQFTAEESDEPSDPTLFTFLRTVPAEQAAEPKLSERLEQRLDEGRSWTSFTNRNFADVFNLPVAALGAAAELPA